MDLNIKHRTIEYDVKAHLRGQYHAHRTAVDNYSGYEGSEYEREAYNLSHNVAKYILKHEGAEKFRSYISTPVIDWNK